MSARLQTQGNGEESQPAANSSAPARTPAGGPVFTENQGWEQKLPEEKVPEYLPHSQYYPRHAGQGGDLWKPATLV